MRSLERNGAAPPLGSWWLRGLQWPPHGSFPWRTEPPLLPHRQLWMAHRRRVKVRLLTYDVLVTLCAAKVQLLSVLLLLVPTRTQWTLRLRTSQTHAGSLISLRESIPSCRRKLPSKWTETSYSAEGKPPSSPTPLSLKSHLARPKSFLFLCLTDSLAALTSAIWLWKGAGSVASI